MTKELTIENQSLTSNWEYGTLEDAVNKGSSNISLNKVKEEDGEYQLYSAKGYNKNISFFHQEKEYLAIIKDGAGIGRVSKHPAKSSVVATMQYLTPKEGFDIGFVQYFLNGIDFESHRQGSTIPHVYFKDYKSEPFPLLPLTQQKQIVAILDQAFAAIATAKANAEQNLQNAKELFESYLQNVFSTKGDDWEEKTLEEVLQKTETVNPKSTPNNEFVYLDVSSVNKETKLIEKTTTLLGKDAPSRARKLVKTNDIIFATVRPTHSRVAIITDEYNNQVCSTGYYVLRPKNIIENHYLFYFILTFGFNKLMESMQKGASYPAVNNKEVESVVINFPKEELDPEEIKSTIQETMNALAEARQAAGASESEVLFGGLEAELQELAASLEESFPENGTDQGGSSEQESEKLQNASKATEELTVALQEQIDQGLIDIEQREGSVFISVGAGGAFPSGTADLTGDAQAILDRIALTAMSPESKITVTGHTDDIPISNGKFRDNWDLAAARAASVVQTIEETGLVSGGRMSAVSKGETDPVADNVTAEGREENRRIEIEISY